MFWSSKIKDRLSVSQPLWVLILIPVPVPFGFWETPSWANTTQLLTSTTTALDLLLFTKDITRKNWTSISIKLGKKRNWHLIKNLPILISILFAVLKSSRPATQSQGLGDRGFLIIWENIILNLNVLEKCSFLKLRSQGSVSSRILKQV